MGQRVYYEFCLGGRTMKNFCYVVNILPILSGMSTDKYK